jgi:fatty-acyl-CoA synthase
MMDYPLTIDRILEYGQRMFPRQQISTKQPDGSMHRYTYAEMYQRVKKLADVLGKLDLQPGDRVGTFAWNNYQHLELYYAIPCYGAVCHTLNLRLSPDQLAYIINHAEDKVIFADGSLVPLLEKIVEEIPGVQQYVLFNAPQDIQTRLPNVSFYEDLLAEADDDYEWSITDENTAAGMCYTSGTTGHPKGALYSHRSTYLHALATNQAACLGFTEQDTALLIVPQFHVMAWGFPYSAFFAGANLVMPGPHLQPAALADLLADEKVTVANGVPTIWTGVYQELKVNPRDISSVRALVIGGSALPRGMIEGYERDFGVNALHAWGMTEMSPLGTISRLQSHHLALSQEAQLDIRAKQGYTLATVEMRVVDDTGQEVARDGLAMGEIQVRGPCVIKSYYQAESDSFTEDGWFRTGDVGMIDADGFMQITDRTKDLIKSGGEWISSVDLENALMGHPHILEAAVIAIPDAKWDERPLAAVVLTAEAEAMSEDEIRTYLAPNFAKFQLPDKFIFIEEVPKTSTGKFDKKVLRAQYAEGILDKEPATNESHNM